MKTTGSFSKSITNHHINILNHKPPHICYIGKLVFTTNSIIPKKIQFNKLKCQKQWYPGPHIATESKYMIKPDMKDFSLGKGWSPPSRVIWHKIFTPHWQSRRCRQEWQKISANLGIQKWHTGKAWQYIVIKCTNKYCLQSNLGWRDPGIICYTLTWDIFKKENWDHPMSILPEAKCKPNNQSKIMSRIQTFSQQ